MVVGESFLKIVDYPFAYSFIAIIGAIFGFSITANKIFLLGIAGALGTFLSIVDPLGWIVRNKMKEGHPQITQKMVNYPITDSYFLGRDSILRSRAITFEIDKIISIVYFSITAGVFLIGIIFSPFLAENFILYNKSNEIVCDPNCIKIFTGIGSGFICLVLGIIGGRRWSELAEKIAISITYQRAISNEFVTTNSLENMTRSLEQNDWVTAYEWGEKIDNEIKFKVGKKDKIIKSIDKIYRPLYSESIGIRSLCNAFLAPQGKRYVTFALTKWNIIKRESEEFLIEDIELKNNIETLYANMQKYNVLLEMVIKEVKDIIFKKISCIFESKIISNIDYSGYQITGGNITADLPQCAIFGITPSEYYKDFRLLKIIVYTIITENTSEPHTLTDEQIKIFDLQWSGIFQNVKKLKSIKDMKELLNKIEMDNEIMLTIYQQKIKLERDL